MLAALPWQRLFEIPQIIFVVGGLIAMVTLIGGFWYKAQKLQSENALKRTLVEHGFSADEIGRIIAAQAEEPSDSDG